MLIAWLVQQGQVVIYNTIAWLVQQGQVVIYNTARVTQPPTDHHAHDHGNKGSPRMRSSSSGSSSTSNSLTTLGWSSFFKMAISLFMLSRGLFTILLPPPPFGGRAGHRTQCKYVRDSYQFGVKHQIWVKGKFLNFKMHFSVYHPKTESLAVLLLWNQTTSATLAQRRLMPTTCN